MRDELISRTRFSSIHEVITIRTIKEEGFCEKFQKKLDLKRAKKPKKKKKKKLKYNGKWFVDKKIDNSIKKAIRLKTLKHEK